jgi:pectin methylesterase-like acyl-CoA thioesterase
MADNFVAENLTFANEKMKTPPKSGTVPISPVPTLAGQRSQASQAPAVVVSGDRALFRNVRLLGNQNTLYAGSKDCASATGQPCTPSRQYFSKCYIEGNVDVISGDGKVVFDRCEIHSTKHSSGVVTAQGKHYPEQESGFVFDHCTLTAEPGVTDVWLGRPWQPYASVVFLNTRMGGHIRAAGWREEHSGETNSLSLAFLAEFNSSGPGAHHGERDSHSKQLSAQEAAPFEIRRFLAGSDQWDPTKRH